MVRQITRLLFFWSGAFGAALFVAAFVLPWFFEWYETARGVPLPYEGVLRLVMLVTIECLLVGAFAFLLVRGKRMHWVLWWIQLFSYGTLLVIFFGDRTHRLMEEFSWIRYTTAGFLVAAAIVALLLAYTKGTFVATKVPFVFWVLVSGVFLYAGLDEILEIHEAMGQFVETKLQLPHVTTDLITVGYAVVALLAIFLMYRRKIFAIREIVQSFPFLVFVLGGATYFVSTMFDTVDVVIGQKLRVLANTLAIRPSFIFSDAWSIIWAPKNFFNGWEEVLEHTAASLFFSALLLLILEKRGMFRSSPHVISAHRKLLAYGVSALFVLLLVSSLALSFPYVFTKVPFVDTKGTFVVSRIAGYFDGLSHTDDLFYHPKWGVLVANEGKGNIYQWKNERWGMVPDPLRRLRDTDSVTADADHVYVSDGSHGTIFQTDGRGQWEALWTKSDGLKHPEGIVAVAGTLYVIDESEKSMTKLVRGKKPEVWKPSHPLWQAPEGIAYDQTMKTLVVTDDVTGAVFRVDFGKSVVPLARLQNPEDLVALSNGNIVVTDNGWGAVFVITPDGTVEKRVQFRRSYRDLQGVAVDDAGRLYVVTADGFDRVSFMPSFLFQISPP